MPVQVFSTHVRAKSSGTTLAVWWKATKATSKLNTNSEDGRHVNPSPVLTSILSTVMPPSSRVIASFALPGVVSVGSAFL